MNPPLGSHDATAQRPPLCCTPSAVSPALSPQLQPWTASCGHSYCLQRHHPPDVSRASPGPAPSGSASALQQHPGVLGLGLTGHVPPPPSAQPTPIPHANISVEGGGTSCPKDPCATDPEPGREPEGTFPGRVAGPLPGQGWPVTPRSAAAWHWRR